MEALTLITHTANMAKPDRLPLNVLVDKFLYDQDVRENSRKVYRRSLKQFFEYTKDAHLDPFNLMRENVIAYKEYLQFKGLSPFTVGGYITAVKLFYSFLQREKISWNVATDIKLPRKPQGARKQPLTASEAIHLLEHLTQQNARNAAIGAIMLHCGLRTIEISRLKVQDLCIKAGGWVLMVHGKGHDSPDQYVQVNAKALALIRGHLVSRPLAGSAMFPSESNNNNGGHLHPITISGIIKQALRAIGLDDRTYTAHGLRHTFGTRLLAAGASLEEVATEMRHSSTNTTKIYTQAIREELRAKKRVTDLLCEVY